MSQNQQPGADGVHTEVTSCIDLTPAEWAWATWRTPQPLAAVPPIPFDRARCLKRLRQLLPSRSWTPLPDWSQAAIPTFMTAEEAAFWFAAITGNSREPVLPAVFHQLEKADFTTPPSLDQIRSELRAAWTFLPPIILRPLFALLGHVSLVELLLDERFLTVGTNLPGYLLTHNQRNLAEGYAQYVLPHLDAAMRDRLRHTVRNMLPASMWSSSVPLPERELGYLLAALLGLHDELLTLVAGWPDDLFHRTSQRASFEELRRRPREMIFGLGDPQLVDRHMRRLGLLLRHDRDVCHWLAHTELTALDHVIVSIRAIRPGNPANASLLEALCRVRAPQVAHPLLELSVAGYRSPDLQRWFDREVGNAVAGLLPVACGRGKVAAAARDYLLQVRRRGLIPDCLQHARVDLAEPDYPPLETTPSWLRLAPAQQQPLPGWLCLEALPALVLVDRRLTLAHLRAVLAALRASRPDLPSPFLLALRQHSEPASREAFAWELVARWQSVGFPPEDGWVMNAVAFLGEDPSVLRLARLVRQATGAHGRSAAVWALQCLPVIGTPLALSILAGLARQLRSRELREEALALLDDVAQARRTSRGELEERIVPHLGFTGSHGPTFDLGGRVFHAVLTPGGKALLRDASGRLRPDLPAPGVRDDLIRAREAASRWRLLRQQLRAVLHDQAIRLERAMMSGQRWSLAHFHHHLLPHPLLGLLARQLLWGGYDERGRLLITFRISDEANPVDADAAPVRLQDINSVRIVHPVELSSDLRQRWSTVWIEHELIPPFVQLGRGLFPLTDEQRRASALTWFRGRAVSILTVSGILGAHDWHPVVLSDGRPRQAHARFFVRANVTAVVVHPHVGQGSTTGPYLVVELQRVFFLHGQLPANARIDPADAVPLGSVPDLARCQVCDLLASICARGKEGTEG